MIAVRIGVRRGWTAFLQSLRSAQDSAFWIVTAGLVLGYLYIRRDDRAVGSELLVPTVSLPGILAALVAFGLVVGPGYQLAMDRADGTLLRHKAVPHGLRGYFASVLTSNSLGLLPQIACILIPAAFLFDGLHHGGAARWLTFAWVLGLGLLATLPIGMIIGAAVPSIQKVGTWGMFPVMALAGISGIFFPVQQLWGWLQVVAQIFPMYWIGLGMRSAFLPDSEAALEVAGSWRHLETVGVLGAWAVAGAILTPIVFRRMARRQSGSAVAAAHAETMQWVR